VERMAAGPRSLSRRDRDKFAGISLRRRCAVRFHWATLSIVSHWPRARILTWRETFST